MESTLTLAVGIIVAVLVATFVAVFILRRAQPAAAAPDTALIDTLRQRADDEGRRAAALELQLRDAAKDGALAGDRAKRIIELESELRETRAALQQARDAGAAAEKRAALVTAQAGERELALQAQIAQLQTSEQRLGKEFENLANRIFTQKQQQFGEQSKQNLDALLTPFREQIEGFRKKVEESYGAEQVERRLLQREIGALKELNERITAEAANLTRALKGDNKLQGNWGEMILERILEISGLQEGREYVSQTGYRHGEENGGKQHITDVIVRLPEGKDVIIDSKVSLLDWERCVAATDDEARIAALNAHALSLRTHVKILSDKDYQKLNGVSSLDYVLMFVPIESAFHAAIAHDDKLVEYALEKNIMLVAPSTLLIALRTIRNLWRYEDQNRNVQEIARIAGTMHDKLAAFVGDLNEIRSALERADKAWLAAQSKLAGGKGNVISQAGRLVKLGAKHGKRIDKDWSDIALPDGGDDDESTDEEPTGKPA